MKDFGNEPNYWEVLLVAVIFIGVAIAFLYIITANVLEL